METRMGRMFRRILIITTLVFTAVLASRFAMAQDHGHEATTEQVAGTHEPSGHETSNEKFNPGEMIFEHILDAYDWHLWGEGDHSVSIPLPVVVYSSQRGLDVFMSSGFHHGHRTSNGYMLHKGPQDKKYNIVAVKETESVDAHTATIDEEITSGLWDLSITKNVVALIISCIILIWIMLAVAKSYVRRKDMAPKGIQSLLEPIIIMIRDDVAKASIGPKYERFIPYLLTIFFFILINNLMGLIPFFPGGANLTGNISVTCTLAVITFVIQLANSNSNFWQHIFAMPGVPKGVLILLTPIEVLGMFLKPFVLMVRLFANITAGHIVALAFISLIFIFNEMYGAAGGFGISFLSGIFYVFMGFLEMLVAFLQAYVFTLLSAIYIGTAMEEHHHEEHAH